MVRLRRATEGLANQERSSASTVMRTLFVVILNVLLILGLIGLIIFINVHWSSFHEAPK